MPALQLPATKYGRRCNADYTVGFLIFEIDKNGGLTWQPAIARLDEVKPPMLVI
jgi:hypothetical protein